MNHFSVPVDASAGQGSILPEHMVQHALDRLQQHLAAPPFRSLEWEALCRSPAHQGYTQYISRAASLIAPDDAQLRGAVAAALVELYYLKDSADLLQAMNDES